MSIDNQGDRHWMVLVSLLREIADSKGLSIRQIAEEAGYHRSHVSRIFQMKYPPSLDSFLKICKVVKVNFFFEDIEGKSDLNILFNRAMDKLGRMVKKGDDN